MKRAIQVDSKWNATWLSKNHNRVEAVGTSRTS
jgi:hypothetical protein